MNRLPPVTALLLLLAAPAAAQEGAWTYRAEPEPVELSYVAPGAFAPALVLACVKDSRQLVARFPVEQRLGVRTLEGRWVDDVGRPAPWPVSVTLTSGEAQTTIPGLADVDPQDGGSLVSVEFADRAPVARCRGWVRFNCLGAAAIESSGSRIFRGRSRRPAAGLRFSPPDPLGSAVHRSRLEGFPRAVRTRNGAQCNP